MNEKADIMVNLIRNKMTKGKTTIEVQHFITLCALDIIVETAMGGKSDLQSLEVQSDYVQAIYDGKFFLLIYILKKYYISNFWSNDAIKGKNDVI